MVAGPLAFVLHFVHGMKQKTSFPLLSVLVLLSTSSVLAATRLPEQKTNVTQAVQNVRARVNNKAAKPGDFVDATGAAPQAAPQAVPQKKKIIGTVVRPMDGHRKAINLNPTVSAPNTVAATVDDTPGVGPIKFGDYRLVIANKNTMTLGRKEELETIGGKNYELFNEMYLGVKHKSGWGADVGMAWDSESNADPSLDTFSRPDMNASLYHPIFSNDTFDMSGRLRVYLPTSESSIANEYRQVRYYNILGINLPHKFSLTHVIFPKFVSRKNPTPESQKSYLYECLELAHQTTKYMALSIGEQTQIDNHNNGTSGMSVDLYPFIDFTITKNILFEPKIYLPVYVSGVVSGGPTNVSLDQSQVEFYLKLSI